MKRRVIALMLVLCLMLSGCSSLLSGQMHWEQTHDIPSLPNSNQELTASDYDELIRVLSISIEQGMEQFSISVGRYNRDSLEADVDQAVDVVCRTNPVAAYAVSHVSCQIGASGGETVLVVRVSYLHDQNEIARIQTVSDNTSARDAIAVAMNACESALVLRIEHYEDEDFLLYVEQYAQEFPQYVMEIPQVSMHLYPETGIDRVLEIRFQYVTGRDALQVMQDQVLTLFHASVNIVSVTENTKNKFTQLYSLLVERFQKYTIETSMTPAYSLLLYGVGDAKAFATIYAAMCREAGLSCQLVVGTKAGKPWYWNIVCVDGVYYHVDLLRSKTEGNLRMMSDTIMEEGYVWDFDAYPACGIK